MNKRPNRDQTQVVPLLPDQPLQSKIRLVLSGAIPVLYEDYYGKILAKAERSAHSAAKMAAVADAMKRLKLK